MAGSYALFIIMDDKNCISGGALAWRVAASAAALWLVLLSLAQITNPDVWFHLSAGRWMLDNWSLLGAEDPFTFTARPLSPEVANLQNGQWLSQVIFYLFYSAGGAAAMVLLRSLLIWLPLAGIYLWAARRLSASWAAASALAFPAAAIVQWHLSAYERPQGLSFAFVLVLLWMLWMLRSGRSAWRVGPLIFILMALWGNLHGGFVVGLVLLLVFAFAEALVWALRRLMGEARASWVFGGSPRDAAVALVAGLMGSALNPSAHGTIKAVAAGLAARGSGASGSFVLGQMAEYRPLLFAYTYFGSTSALFIMAYMGLVLLLMGMAALERRRLDLAEALTGIVISAMGFAYMRMVPFSLIVLAALGAGAIAGLGRWRMRAASALLIALALLSFAPTVRSGGWARLVPSFKSQWMGGGYPVNALEFMRSSGAPARVFNPVHWGGYMVFFGYVDRAFVDGRSVDEGALRDAHTILNAGPGWEALLDRHEVNTIVIPVIAPETRDPVPLAMYLPEHSNWKLAYIDYNALVAVRAGTWSAQVSPWRDMWTVMERLSLAWIQREPRNPVLHMARTISLHNLGRYDEARQAAAQAIAAADAWGPQRGAEVRAILRARGY